MKEIKIDELLKEVREGFEFFGTDVSVLFVGESNNFIYLKIDYISKFTDKEETTIVSINKEREENTNFEGIII